MSGNKTPYHKKALLELVEEMPVTEVNLSDLLPNPRISLEQYKVLLEFADKSIEYGEDKAESIIKTFKVGETVSTGDIVRLHQAMVSSDEPVDVRIVRD